LKVYNGCYHCLHLEKKKIDIFKDIILWINDTIMNLSPITYISSLQSNLVIIRKPPENISWGKIYLYLSALCLYLAFGYLYCSIIIYNFIK